ncbi:MAG: glycosyltransferase [Thiobacillaceae bacterium]|nr:glycosyltransferase [Thiobacillaceae bacterium]
MSIVLHAPDLPLLQRVLAALNNAVRQAKTCGALGEVQLLLIDHSPHALCWEDLQRLQGVCADVQRGCYIHNPSNPGFGSGHNKARRMAPTADYFMVLNPDVILAADALTTGLVFMRENPEVALIGPAWIEADGTMRPACYREPDLLTLMLRGLGFTANNSQRIARYECRDWDAPVPVYNPPLISGSCMLFRGDAYDRLGGFDTGYFLYFEDFDLSRRASRMGVSAYVPAMQVRHHGGGVAKKGWRHWLWFVKSAIRYHWRAHNQGRYDN